MHRLFEETGKQIGDDRPPVIGAGADVVDRKDRVCGEVPRFGR